MNGLGMGHDMTGQARLLRVLSDAVNAAPPRKRSAVVRAAEAALSSLAATAALPLAARWFLKTQTVRRRRNASQDFWASRVTPEGAAELRRLVARFVVLYAESRQCHLVGNSGASWAYSALALLPAPPGEALQPRLIGQLFEQVAAAKTAHDLRPEEICFEALGLTPKGAALRVRYEYEHPDWLHGHFMMRLEVDGEDVVKYWPQLKGAEFNHVDREGLAEVCGRLALRHVCPLQLATFLAVLASAAADGTESWGGEQGVFFFREGSLPFKLKHLRQGAGD